MPSTVLGFDFGMKKIGVAVGQTVTKTANPLAVLRASRGIPNWENIRILIQTWKADALVVGVPYHMNRTEQPLTQAARQFAQQLQAHFSLPVYTIDERLTTIEAKQQLRQQGQLPKQLDSYAAKLIVEQWLQESFEENQ